MKEFNYNLKKGHILLVDTKNNFLLGKKRNPDKLFQDKIIKKIEKKSGWKIYH